MDKPIKAYVETIIGKTLYNAYQYLNQKIGDTLGDSIAIKVMNKSNDILYEEDCHEQVDGTLDTIDNDDLKQIVVSAEYINDYYGDGGHIPKKHRVIKPVILIIVE